jgi:RNA polymerase sigma-70 factor (ECF subfamily)
MPLENHNPGDDQMLDQPGGDSPADREWVRSAVARYEGPLTTYARNVLGGDADRAQDVVQEAFLRLIGQDRAKVGPHLAEWLYTVCRNLAIDVRRKDRRTERLNDADADSAVSDAPAPGERSEHDDALTHVLSNMRRLPRNQQECIRLKFQGGLSYKEISRVTNLTVTNVGFLIHTGLKTLRQRLVDAEAEAQQERENAVVRPKRPSRPPPPMARNES